MSCIIHRLISIVIRVCIFSEINDIVDKCYYCHRNTYYIFWFYVRPSCGYCYYDYCDTAMMFSDVL